MVDYNFVFPYCGGSTDVGAEGTNKPQDRRLRVRTGIDFHKSGNGNKDATDLIPHEQIRFFLGGGLP